MSELKPHLKVLGSANPYTLSIAAPSADTGMTPSDCAGSLASSIVSQYGLSPTQIVAKQLNEETFALFFSEPLEEKFHAHAYFFSGYQGTHCINVHLSSVQSEQEVSSWANKFLDTRIETY